MKYKYRIIIEKFLKYFFENTIQPSTMLFIRKHK